MRCKCPLSGAKQTSFGHAANDPKRTFHHPRPGLILRREKSFRLVEKFLPGWFTFQKRMIAA
ncbi:MAG: hypothetical protein WA439_16350, partial [Pseudolabrys sp.]